QERRRLRQNPVLRGCCFRQTPEFERVFAGESLWNKSERFRVSLKKGGVEDGGGEVFPGGIEMLKIEKQLGTCGRLLPIPTGEEALLLFREAARLWMSEGVRAIGLEVPSWGGPGE